MSILVGDENGLYKQVNYTTGEVVQVYGKQERGAKVHDFALLSRDEGHDWVVARGSSIDVVAPESGEVLSSMPVLSRDPTDEKKENDNGNKPARPLSTVGLTTRADGSILACSSHGFVHNYTPEGEFKFGFQTAQPIDAFTCSAVNENLVAVGGQEILLRVYDVATQKIAFKAKNVPNTFLDLRVPEFISSIDFAPGSDRVLVTGNMHKRIRLHDTRAKQRPVQDMEASGHPVTAVKFQPNADSRYVIYGDRAGNTRRMDLRKQGHSVSGYHGCAGSVRAVLCHPTEALVHSVSLDRHLRTYKVDARPNLIKKVYLKQQLTAAMLLPPFSEGKTSSHAMKRKLGDESDSGGEEEDDEDQEMWSKLEQAPKRKKHSSQ
jgi:WD40 repeat protein